MRSLGVVEFEPLVDDAFGLESVPQFVQIDGLLFKGPPQPFDEDVVEVSPPSICYRQVFARKHREAWRS